MTISQNRFYNFAKQWIVPRSIPGMKIEVAGLEHVPSGGAVLAGNHRSDFDPAVLISAIPRHITFLTAGYMDRIPVLGYVYWKAGAIAIRSRRFGQDGYKGEIDRRLRDNKLVAIYPEGEEYIRRNDFAAAFTEFHPGFAVFAWRGRVPVVPFVTVPLEEEITPIQFFPRLLRWLRLSPPGYENVTHVARYKSIKLIFGEPIDTANLSAVPERAAVDQLILNTRTAMFALWDQVMEQ